MRLFRIVMPYMLAYALLGFMPDAMAADDGLRNLPRQGTVSVTPNGGSTFGIYGDFVKGASESATLTIGSSTITADIKADSQKFIDVYSQPMVLGLSVDYGLSNSTEIFGGFRFMRATSKEFTAAKVTLAGNFAGTALAVGTEIKGEFSNYSELGFDLGVRHFFRPGSNFRPFASISAGLAYADSVNLDLRAAGAAVNDIKYFSDSVTYALGFGLGFRYEPRAGVLIGLETGVRYTGKMNSDDTDWKGTGNFEEVNDSGERLEIPVLARMTIAF